MEFLKLSSTAQLSVYVWEKGVQKLHELFKKSRSITKDVSQDTLALAQTLCSAHRLKESIVWGPIVGAHWWLFSLHRSRNASVGAEEQSSPCSFSFAMLSFSILISLDAWIRQKSQMLQAINCFVPAHKRDVHKENPGLWVEVTTYLVLWHVV